MSDLISRQDAIDALQCEWCVEKINNIPSAEPKTGKWIDYSDEGYVECPFCHSATTCDGNKDELHFCFSCGADMREESEEDHDYERAVDQMEHDILYEPTYNPEDGSM